VDKFEKNGEEITVKIWDTAGQERFRTITQQFYRQAHGIIVCFDLSNDSSFQNVKNWMTSIYKNTSPQIYKVLVGNKVDLEERVVSKQDAEKLA
jgi:small GTP-binding protein